MAHDTMGKCVLLELPLEIFLRISEYLYNKDEVYVECQPSEQPGEPPLFLMKKVPMSAQFTRTCRRIYQEANPLLYGNRTFNCSQREGLKLLLQSVGPQNFPLIKHIILDWEQLQELAWSLAKPDRYLAMSGLEIVELATWRMRIIGGSSFLWREVKSYERSLCSSAKDICEKHPKLSIVAQRPFHKSHRAGSSHRVKWRLITSAAHLRPDEIVVPIEEELSQLLASGDSESGGRGAQLFGGDAF